MTCDELKMPKSVQFVSAFQNGWFVLQAGY